MKERCRVCGKINSQIMEDPTASHLTRRAGTRVADDSEIVVPSRALRQSRSTTGLARGYRLLAARSPRCRLRAERGMAICRTGWPQRGTSSPQSRKRGGRVQVPRWGVQSAANNLCQVGGSLTERRFTYCLSVDHSTPHASSSVVDCSFHRRVVNVRLFPGHLVNRDDQQDHHEYADHRPNPHPSAHPSVHMVHHEAPFVALRPAHHCTIRTVSGGSSIICLGGAGRQQPYFARHRRPQQSVRYGRQSTWGSPTS